MSSANKIFLGSVHRNNPEQIERTSTTAVSSGMLAIITGTFPGKFIPHNVAGASPGMHYVVKEPILGPVNYTWALTDTAAAYIAHSGEIYQMRTTAAAYTFDQALTSAGDGTLKAANGTTDIVVCYSDEAITTTSGAPFLRVKFR
jgi:hypothetical protein